jgi:hypothetical protein
MKLAAAIILTIGSVLAGCAPYTVYESQAPTPLVNYREQQEECSLIRREIAHQQRIAALSPVMETELVEAAVRLNAANVISGLATRAAIEGCRV